MRKFHAKTFQHVLLVAFCSLVFFALPARADEFRQTSHYNRRLFSSATFTMEVRTGDIYITGWDDPHVEIEAEKVVHASSREAAEQQYQRIQVLLDGQDEMLHLYTLYPPRRPWRPFHGESNLSVDFHIHMPYDCNLVIKCVDGDVTVRGVAGQETITVNYGQVEIDVPSVGRLRSVRAKTWLGNVQSDLHGENDAGFSKKVLFWNATGTQDISLKVHMGGIYIFSGEDE
ncbi:MAG: hypothetical protein EPN47_06010 [Acidobacteria bacterium]|nr:MAG: hypothetical protein EPN47_06010 [Acidobacteriota bacterium]